MNNKTKTYILLAAVLFIWGAIAYQFVNGLPSEDVADTPQNSVSDFKPKPIAQRSTFTIDNTVRDPFLGTLESTYTPKTNTKPSKPKSKTPLPFIAYKGWIKKQQTANSIYIVNINNRQHLIKKGQMVDSVTLVKGNASAIVIQYQKTNHTIKRQ